MSAALESTDAVIISCCASCGKAAVDNVKLKQCACKLVRYCSVECQKNHRKQHKKACKKRIAEVRENKLFEQPEGNHFGECPLCCLPNPLGDFYCWPLSTDMTKTTMKFCCSTLICTGCSHANYLREIKASLDHKCPFCREPAPENDEEKDKRLVKRVEANDPNALCEMGKKLRDEEDYEGAFEYFKKSAEIGNAEAHYVLSIMYHEGEGVERDTKKDIYHLEEAAIGGHPWARFHLGLHDVRSGRVKRAMQHFIIAANLGLDEGLEEVKQGFVAGIASKDEYAVALRGHQAAVDATTSVQREKTYEMKLYD